MQASNIGAATASARSACMNATRSSKASGKTWLSWSGCWMEAGLRRAQTE